MIVVIVLIVIPLPHGYARSATHLVARLHICVTRFRSTFAFYTFYVTHVCVYLYHLRFTHTHWFFTWIHVLRLLVVYVAVVTVCVGSLLRACVAGFARSAVYLLPLVLTVYYAFCGYLPFYCGWLVWLVTLLLLPRVRTPAVRTVGYILRTPLLPPLPFYHIYVYVAFTLRLHYRFVTVPHLPFLRLPLHTVAVVLVRLPVCYGYTFSHAPRALPVVTRLLHRIYILRSAARLVCRTAAGLPVTRFVWLYLYGLLVAHILPVLVTHTRLFIRTVTLPAVTVTTTRFGLFCCLRTRDTTPVYVCLRVHVYRCLRTVTTTPHHWFAFTPLPLWVTPHGLRTLLRCLRTIPRTGCYYLVRSTPVTFTTFTTFHGYGSTVVLPAVTLRFTYRFRFPTTVYTVLSHLPGYLPTRVDSLHTFVTDTRSRFVTHVCGLPTVGSLHGYTFGCYVYTRYRTRSLRWLRTFGSPCGSGCRCCYTAFACGWLVVAARGLRFLVCVAFVRAVYAVAVACLLHTVTAPRLPLPLHGCGCTVPLLPGYTHVYWLYTFVAGLRLTRLHSLITIHVYLPDTHAICPFCGSRLRTRFCSPTDSRTTYCAAAATFLFT